MDTSADALLIGADGAFFFVLFCVLLAPAVLPETPKLVPHSRLWQLHEYSTGLRSSDSLPRCARLCYKAALRLAAV